jgi:hypothetical protein
MFAAIRCWFLKRRIGEREQLIRDLSDYLFRDDCENPIDLIIRIRDLEARNMLDQHKLFSCN